MKLLQKKKRWNAIKRRLSARKRPFCLRPPGPNATFNANYPSENINKFQWNNYLFFVVVVVVCLFCYLYFFLLKLLSLIIFFFGNYNSGVDFHLIWIWLRRSGVDASAISERLRATASHSQMKSPVMAEFVSFRFVFGAGNWNVVLHVAGCYIYSNLSN